MYDTSGTRLRLLSRSSSNPTIRSTSVVDELARSSWFGGLLHCLFVPRAVEEVIDELKSR